VQSLHALREVGFALVEEGGFAGSRELMLQLALQSVGANGHPVVDPVGHQVELFADLPIVQQIGLGEQELLDLVLEVRATQIPERSVGARSWDPPIAERDAFGPACVQVAGHRIGQRSTDARPVGRLVATERRRRGHHGFGAASNAD